MDLGGLPIPPGLIGGVQFDVGRGQGMYRYAGGRGARAAPKKRKKAGLSISEIVSSYLTSNPQTRTPCSLFFTAFPPPPPHPP